MKSIESKNPLRIVYMGTPDFAVAGLKLLLDKGYDIVGVITAPDRPAGRGRKLRESSVKVFAKQHGLHIMQPTNLKSDVFLEELRGLKANLQVVVAFRMLPKVVWQMPEYGTFNLHASLLPQYRGAAPINWAIINGETETGVTTFFIDEKIDTGEMLLQERVAIGPNDDAGQLHDRLMTVGAEVILQTVVQIEKGQTNPTKQPHDPNLKAAPKISKETCKIDWSAPAQSIYDHIRGLSPYPAAWASVQQNGDEFPLKIYKATFERTQHTLTPLCLLTDKKTIKVALEEGYLNLLEIQLPGKRKMNAADVLNGFSFSKTAYVR